MDPASPVGSVVAKTLKLVDIRTKYSEAHIQTGSSAVRAARPGQYIDISSQWELAFLRKAAEVVGPSCLDAAQRLASPPS
jgi:hypothetical protein